MAKSILESLKSLDIPEFSKHWVERHPDYVTTLGLTREDVPDLIAILELWGDESFFQKPGSDLEDEDEDSEEFDEDYEELEDEEDEARQRLLTTPIHAWRALAQLGAIEAVEPMLKMLDELSKAYDDWYLEEFPLVFRMIGPAALPRLDQYLGDPSHEDFARVCAADGILYIAQHYEATRTEATAMLRQALQNYKSNPIELNAFLADHLVELHSVEDAELIERAFADECVDEGVFGTWKDARKRLGVPGLGLAPDKPHPTIGLLPQMQREFQEATGTKSHKTKSAKKRQEKSRKRNRKHKH